MLLFLKKKVEEPDNSAGPEPVRAVPTSEFIPYYCHWDAHTLLTKNGELMQTLRITGDVNGLDYESGDPKAGQGAATVRETIRAAIIDCIDSDKFALWIHTVRKRRRFQYTAQFKEGFAAWAHERWQKKKNWKYQYYNEIYISILHEGQTAGLFEKEAIRHVFLHKRNREYRNAYLEKAAKDLERTASALLTKLSTAYNAHRLSAVERKGIFYSEPVEFLSQLINLRSEPAPLSETDLSQALASSQLTFGFNALETKTAAKRRFAAVLTLKHYSEIPPDTADRVLQAPMEFIVSEAFNFIPSEEALKPYKEQKELFETSGDENSIGTSGIIDMMNSDRGRPVDFGQHQINIMVLADDYKHLDSEIVKIRDGFGDFGLIPIREDIMLEECFWAQLPGNFEFIRRKSTINTARIGGFCRLNRFPIGSAGGNHWGPAVVVAPTIVNSPYFLNFHQGNNGHTVMLDFNSFHDQLGYVLMNFLLAETRKYNGRLCIFDRDQSARLLFSKLGGNYHAFPTLTGERHPLHQSAAGLKINPFTLEDNPRNRSFLLAWATSLMAPALTVADAQKEAVRAAIDQLYAGEPGQRHLAALVQTLSAADPALAKALGAWHGNGKFAGVFDSAEDGFDTTHLLNAFDMTPVTQHPETIIPIFSYLLHRLIMTLDGQPTIIVLHEAWDLVENAFFAPRLESLLEMLKEHNAMVIFTSGKPLAHTGAHSFNTVIQNCPTHLYIPDDIDFNYAVQNLGLNENDVRLLYRMKRQRGEFLVKQNNEAIALRIDLAELDDLWAVLANDSKSLAGTGKK